jgi:glyoxylase-like metal-dependent hydrolase (beta-lactamase superfamily II)
MAARVFGGMMLIQRIEVRETNCYLLKGKAGAILIDPGPPGGAEAVIAAIKQAGLQPVDIKLILISHGHLDHYGAAAQVKDWCSAPIAAYPSEPSFSQDRRNALPPAQTVRGSLVRWLYFLLTPLTHPKPLEADHLLDDGTNLVHFGVAAKVMLVPGHSPGSLAVVTSEGDTFVGDLFVNYSVPSQPIYLSDRGAWRQSYERILALDPRMVYVGHGEPFRGDQLDPIHPARYQLRWWVR